MRNSSEGSFAESSRGAAIGALGLAAGALLLAACSGNQPPVHSTGPAQVQQTTETQPGPTPQGPPGT